jgi:hypothetical protein
MRISPKGGAAAVLPVGVLLEMQRPFEAFPRGFGDVVTAPGLDAVQRAVDSCGGARTGCDLRRGLNEARVEVVGQTNPVHERIRLPEGVEEQGVRSGLVAVQEA